MVQGISSDDVTKSLIKDLGVNVVVVPVTLVDNLYGDRITKPGTEKTIKAYVYEKNEKFMTEKFGLANKKRTFLMCAVNEDVKKDYEIKHKDRTYVVYAILDVGTGVPIDLFKKVELKLKG
jgi:hypothetical protein